MALRKMPREGMALDGVLVVTSGTKCETSTNTILARIFVGYYQSRKGPAAQY